MVMMSPKQNCVLTLFIIILVKLCDLHIKYLSTKLWSVCNSSIKSCVNNHITVADNQDDT